tara:strand:- start:123 stop:266 length:144 start_codon:yes stop_codon:yes gene_type:complete
MKEDYIECDYCGEEAVVKVDGLFACDVCKDMANAESKWTRACLLVDR